MKRSKATPPAAKLHPIAARPPAWITSAIKGELDYIAMTEAGEKTIALGRLVGLLPQCSVAYLTKLADLLEKRRRRSGEGGLPLRIVADSSAECGKTRR